MYSIEMLPAQRGDCLWIEYGADNSPGKHRILIDGGVVSSGKELRRRIELLDKDDRYFELLVVTHIDFDHIAGILNLLEDPPEGLRFGDVWYNAWEHLPQEEEDGLLGAKQGERLAAILEKSAWKWNAAFDGQAVALNPADQLPEVQLPGGMQITLLSPTRHRLAELRPVWEKEIVAAGMVPGDAYREPEDEDEDEGVLGDTDLDIDDLARTPFKPDQSEANGSSIAFLAEFEGTRCLFTGDAFADDLAAALNRFPIKDADERVGLDAFKISHHGGPKNTSPELLRQVTCSRFLFSTNGSYYKHPYPESVARVIVHGRNGTQPRLYFNYRSNRNTVWDDPGLSAGRYTPHYPGTGEGLRVEF